MEREGVEKAGIEGIPQLDPGCPDQVGVNAMRN